MRTIQLKPADCLTWISVDVDRAAVRHWRAHLEAYEAFMDRRYKMVQDVHALLKVPACICTRWGDSALQG